MIVFTILWRLTKLGLKGIALALAFIVYLCVAFA